MESMCNLRNYASDSEAEAKAWAVKVRAPGLVRQTVCEVTSDSCDAGNCYRENQLAHVSPRGSQPCMFAGPCLVCRLPGQLLERLSVFTSRNTAYNP